jgi:hypothetical protein
VGDDQVSKRVAQSGFLEPVKIQLQGAPTRIQATYSYQGTYHVEFAYDEYVIQLGKKQWEACGCPDTIFIEIPQIFENTPLLFGD